MTGHDESITPEVVPPIHGGTCCWCGKEPGEDAVDLFEREWPSNRRRRLRFCDVGHKRLFVTYHRKYAFEETR